MQIRPYFPYLFWVLTVFKVDKGKASWASRLLVIHNVDVTQRAIFGENFPEIPLSGVQTQSKHTQTVVWIWVGLRSMRRDVKTQINNKIPNLWNIKRSEVVTETFCVQKLKQKYSAKSESIHVEEALDTYPVANVSATVWHWWTAMAPAAMATPAARSAPWAASVWSGTGAWVVPAWAPVGTRSVDGNTFNST